MDLSLELRFIPVRNGVTAQALSPRAGDSLSVCGTRSFTPRRRLTSSGSFWTQVYPGDDPSKSEGWGAYKKNIKERILRKGDIGWRRDLSGREVTSAGMRTVAALFICKVGDVTGKDWACSDTAIAGGPAAKIDSRVLRSKRVPGC
jgi:hypothetical protein